MNTALAEVGREDIDLNWSKLGSDRGYRAKMWVEWDSSILVGIVAQSHIYCAMLDAGDPLPEISEHRAWLYQMIGREQILGELYWKHGRNKFFGRMCKYNKDDQRRLVNGDAIDIFAVGDDGEFDWKKADIDRLTDGQWNQVLGQKGIADKRAQTLWLNEKKNNAAIRAARPSDPVVVKLAEHNKFLVSDGPVRMSKREVADLFFSMK